MNSTHTDIRSLYKEIESKDCEADITTHVSDVSAHGFTRRTVGRRRGVTVPTTFREVEETEEVT